MNNLRELLSWKQFVGIDDQMIRDLEELGAVDMGSYYLIDRPYLEYEYYNQELASKDIWHAQENYDRDENGELRVYITIDKTIKQRM